MPEAARYIEALDLKIDELENPEFKPILEKAESRVEEAVLLRSIGPRSPKDDVEIPSFPIAVMLVAATDDSRIKRTYALAEAKRVSDQLKEESKEVVAEIADNFNWKLGTVEDCVGKPSYDFTLHFTDFVKNAAIIQDKKWKLVNRTLLQGEVYLTRNETSRLLEEEVRRYIEKRLETKVGELPPDIMTRVERLKQLFFESRGKTSWEDVPKQIVVGAYPPCIKSLYGTLSSGRHLSHIGRFTLTTFLVNIGMAVEGVIDLFRALSDFNERMTRYQVEHIAGRRGSRTKYIPPRCDTLRTHGVCQGMDDICETIRHPLGYYRRQVRVVGAETPVSP